MATKKCFVPSCIHDSEQSMNKIFIMVPIREDIRMRWCAAVSRPFSKTKKLYCCEDHFNLKCDMSNWMEYKLIGSRIYMREDVIPHKFISSPKRTKHPLKSQLSSSSRKRRSYSLERLGDEMKQKFELPPSESRPEVCLIMNHDPPALKFSEVPISYPSEESLIEGCISGLPTQITYYQPEQTVHPTHSDKQIQVNIKPKYRSVCIGTNIHVRSCGTNTTHPKKTVLTTR